MDLLGEKLWHRPIQRKTEVETIRIEALVRWSGKTMGLTQETGTWKPTGKNAVANRATKDSGKHCDFRRRKHGSEEKIIGTKVREGSGEDS